LDDCHLLGFAKGNLPASPQEADLSGFLDDPGTMDRKMRIEEFSGARCLIRLDLPRWLVEPEPVTYFDRYRTHFLTYASPKPLTFNGE
jgi:hypothetical protein